MLAKYIYFPPQEHCVLDESIMQTRELKHGEVRLPAQTHVTVSYGGGFWT